MKNLVSISSLIVLISILLSCDGRDRVNKSPKEVLIENKLLDSFSENITYIPESYSEKITDTILSNDFKVKTKSSINLENSIKVSKVVDSIRLTNYHRKITTAITVKYNEKVIFNSEEITNQLEQFDFKNGININQSITYVDSKNIEPLNNAEVKIPVIVTDPVNEKVVFISLLIKNDGSINFIEGKKLLAYNE